MRTPPVSHHYRFDPTYGMDLADLLAIVPPVGPGDFADFWQSRYATALEHDPQPRLRHRAQVLGRHTVSDLHYRSTGGVKIGGWLLVPCEQPVRRGAIIGHGYPGRTAPDELKGLDDAAVLFPCFRGTGRSPVPGLSSAPRQHVLHGIECRNRYILGGCVDDLWLAVSVLLSLFPQVLGRVACLGGSFAGGISALAAPWDRRINRLFLEFPAFGHRALLLSLPSEGSSEALRRYRGDGDFNVMDTLAYYDAATAAAFTRVPALVATALFDPVVPPPAQFAVYNAIPASLRRLFVLTAGHVDYPDKASQQQALDREVDDFLTAP